MELPARPHGIEVVAKRVDFLEALAEEPRRKRDLTESLGHSRSTVNRAVDALEDERLVERVSDGWVATRAGRLAAERYRAFLADQREILGEREVVNAVPEGVDLPVEVVESARVEPLEGTYRLFETVADGLRDADHYRAVLPRVADSRHVRAIHAGVTRQGLTADLVVPESVATRLRREFPALAREMARTDRVALRVAETPPLGVLLSWGDGTPASEPPTDAVVVTYEDGRPSGLLTLETQGATDWAREIYRDVADTARDVTEEIAKAEEHPELSQLTDDRLPTRLRAQGFARVDDEFFARRDPLPPTAAVRAGLDLPEVEAGYAVDRRREEDAPPLRRDLLETLEAGKNVALLGPPGSGKSTVCKLLACEWYHRDIGDVLYRASGDGEPFESVAALESAIERSRGCALVVVENAVRAAAAKVFEVMRRTAGRDDVVFLLDSREGEWHDPEEFPIDARLEAFRREAVTTVSMPPVSVDDCRRLVDRVESLTDSEVGVSAPALLAEVRHDAEDPEVVPPGEMYTLAHRLAQHAVPLAEYDADGPTTLEASVDRVRSTLKDQGRTAMDVGVLANALNAAGIDVSPAYFYALSAGPDGRDPTAVREAIGSIEGRVVFDRPDGERSGPYRTVPESWSAEFLERWLDDVGEAEARRTFGRCLDAALALADAPDRREAVAVEVGHDSDALERIVTAPGQWADETVEQVLELGRKYGQLAPLLGDSDDSSFALPEVCSETVVARAPLERGRAYYFAGDYPRATREYEHVLETADSLEGSLGERLTVDALIGLSRSGTAQGEYDEAERYARRAVKAADGIDYRRGSAYAKQELGSIHGARGDHERSKELLTEALSTLRELGLERDIAETFGSLGKRSELAADYDEALEYYERELEIRERIGHDRGRASALVALGTIGIRRQEPERARDRLLKGLEISRERGYRRHEMGALHGLGGLSMRTGEMDAADRYFERAIRVADRIGDPEAKRSMLSNRGEIARVQGDYERARRHSQDSLDIARDLGLDAAVAGSLRNLTALALHDGDYDAALERAREALEYARAADDPKLEAEVLHRIGIAYRGLAEFERAMDRFDEALEIAREKELRHQADVLVDMATVEQLRGEYEAARRLVEEASNLATAPTTEIEVPKVRAALAFRTGQFEVARDHFERVAAEGEELIDDEAVALALVSAADAALRTDDLEAASEYLDEAGALTDGDTPDAVGALSLVRAEIRRRRGDLDGATTDLETARNHLTDGFLYGGGQNRLQRGAFRLELPLREALVARDEGDLERARERLEAVVERDRFPGNDTIALEAIEVLVDVCSDLGDTEAADEWYARGETLVDDSAHIEMDVQRARERASNE